MDVVRSGEVMKAEEAKLSSLDVVAEEKPFRRLVETHSVSCGPGGLYYGTRKRPRMTGGIRTEKEQPRRPSMTLLLCRYLEHGREGLMPFEFAVNTSCP